MRSRTLMMGCAAGEGHSMAKMKSRSSQARAPVGGDVKEAAG